MVYLQVFWVLLLGWAGGVTVNYLADVLPVSRRLTKLSCATCGAPLALSRYLVAGNKCRLCGAGNLWRSISVLLSFSVISLWLWAFTPGRLGYLPGFLLWVYFGVVVVIDLEHRLILHMVSVAGAILGFALGVWLHGISATILGGVVGFSIMLGLYWAGGIYLKWLSRRKDDFFEDEALGFGDVNLMGVAGLILGWPGILTGVILTILLAGIVSLVYLVLQTLRGRYRVGAAIPFGPFIVAGMMLLLFFKDLLLRLLR